MFKYLQELPFIQPQLWMQDKNYVLRTALATNSPDTEETRRGVLSKALSMISSAVTQTSKNTVDVKIWVENTSRMLDRPK